MKLATSRKLFDQILDGIIVAGIWILAFLLPIQVYPPQGDVIHGSILFGLPLAIIFAAYIVKSLRDALNGAKVRIDDLVARVIAPLVIFIGTSVLYFT